MSNRRTAIGFMCRNDPPAAYAEIKRVLMRCNGATKAAARDLGLERRQMLRLIHRYSLWHFVWSLRRVENRRRAQDEIERGLR